MSSADYPLACIDLSNPDRQAIALQIRKACIDCGFFYVINHGVEQKLFDLVFEQSRRFFALPQEEKMKLVLNESHRGYTPLQAEALDPSVQLQGDWKESFYIGPEFSETNGDSRNRFHGPNQWPSNDLLPQWREIMQDYYANVLFHIALTNANLVVEKGFRQLRMSSRGTTKSPMVSKVKLQNLQYFYQ